MTEKIRVYDGNNESSVTAAIAEAERALLAFNATVAPGEEQAEEESGPVSIPENRRLIGIDPAVYRQIEAAINSKKSHLMFYGPPGTGKTELARYVADIISPNLGYTLVTGSADWTSQDLIGGYQPIGQGQIAFVPGILLKAFDRPFIIDELNRCDIDKVLGPLFTVLSKHSTVLPYRSDVAKTDSEQFEILGIPDATAKPPKFAPTDSWRLIATINTVDKASLYQMSYALSRRFAWIFVDVPSDLDDFVLRFLRDKRGIEIDGTSPLSTIWNDVNAVRPIGAAPFIDVIGYCLAVNGGFDFSSEFGALESQTYVDAFMVNVLPMLDGVLKDEMSSLAQRVAGSLRLTEGLSKKLESQMVSVGL